MTVPVRVALERDHALIDALCHVNEYGEEIYIYHRLETDVTRDKYTSIKARDYGTPEKKTLYAFPVKISPTQRQLEKAGMREVCDAIVTIAMKGWTDLSLRYEDIDAIRYTVVLRSQKYIIHDKSAINQFADTFLNINLGLKKI